MIVVNNKKFETIEEALSYFEITICRITNKFLGNHPEKEDCRQELRLAVWQLYSNPDKTYNSSYILRRLKWNTINFINRDDGYNWDTKFVSFDIMTDLEKDSVLSMIIQSDMEDLLNEIDIEDLLKKVSSSLSKHQLEALVIFLSGAPSDLIKTFFGVGNRQLTKYYLYLAEAFAIIKEEVNEKNYN